MLYAAGLAFAAALAALAFVARRGLHPAIEGIAAGALIAGATNLVSQRDLLELGGRPAWRGFACAASLVTAYAVVRTIANRR